MAGGNVTYQVVMNTPIQTTLPSNLVLQAKAFVEGGWAGDFDALLAEALRRYLESHTTSLVETFIRDDVQWGLHGRD
jgi:hypothetical protein